MKEKYEQFIATLTQYFKKTTLSDNSIKVTRDWNFLLGLMVTVVIALCGLGVYVFFFAKLYTDNGKSDEVFVSTTFDKVEFENILQTQKERQSMFFELKDNPPPTPHLGIEKKVFIEVVEEGEEDM